MNFKELKAWNIYLKKEVHYFWKSFLFKKKKKLLSSQDKVRVTSRRRKSIEWNSHWASSSGPLPLPSNLHWLSSNGLLSLEEFKRRRPAVRTDYDPDPRGIGKNPPSCLQQPTPNALTQYEQNKTKKSPALFKHDRNKYWNKG